MARNYAALPHEYKSEMDCLTDAEFGRLCRALLEYSADGTPIALSGNERFFAKRVQMQEDRFRDSYEELRISKSEAGKKGMGKRWGDNKDNKDNSVTTVITDDNKDNSVTTVITDDNKNKYTKTKTKTKTKTDTPVTTVTGVESARARFAPPSVEEVAAYCVERGNGIDAQQFVDFYASKGWKVGSAPMKDWKAAVRTWEKRERPHGKGWSFDDF